MLQNDIEQRQAAAQFTIYYIDGMLYKSVTHAYVVFSRRFFRKIRVFCFPLL